MMLRRSGQGLVEHAGLYTTTKLKWSVVACRRKEYESFGKVLCAMLYFAVIAVIRTDI